MSRDGSRGAKKLDEQVPLLLDVTLRDGGYINNWAFTEMEIRDLVARLAEAGVEFTELGYLSDHTGLSLALHCPPSLLRTLHHKQHHIKLAAMLRSSEPDPACILTRRRDYPDLVRIPTSIAHPEAALRTARCVADAGLACSINLTNISAFSLSEILQAVREVVQAGTVEMMYLADSRGAITPDEVAYLVKRVRTVWDGDLGFHAHDNLGLAIENAQAALDAGCNLIDGSINGFAQGGGNAPLQSLAKMLAEKRGDVSGHHSLRWLAERLGYTMPDSERVLYRLSGQKNVSQDWMMVLMDRYPAEQLKSWLERIPRHPYMSLEEVLAAFGLEARL